LENFKTECAKRDKREKSRILSEKRRVCEVKSKQFLENIELKKTVKKMNEIIEEKDRKLKETKLV
jgi:hypothetical protein